LAKIYRYACLTLKCNKSAYWTKILACRLSLILRPSCKRRVRR